MGGHKSKQWVETARHNLIDYESFRKASLNTWWSASRQSLVKCSLYQGRYNRQSNLSLSGHFLKYATVASYLEPRPTDEVIEAIRYHFPISVQRAMLSTQLRSVGEALDLLKRVEILEANEGANRPTNSPIIQGPYASRSNPNPHGNLGADRKAKYVTYSTTSLILFILVRHTSRYS
jgi:hypothetical protein